MLYRPNRMHSSTLSKCSGQHIDSWTILVCRKELLIFLQNFTYLLKNHKNSKMEKLALTYSSTNLSYSYNPRNMKMMNFCTDVCPRACELGCLCVWVRACVRAWMPACVYACVRASLDACVYACVRASLDAFVYACVRACM